MRLARVPAVILLVLTLAFLPAFVPPAQANFPVIDSANLWTNVQQWLEEIAQYLQMILDYAQQVQHYVTLVKQYEWMLKNLDNLENPFYFQLFGWWGSLLEVIRLGEAVGHSLENLTEVFDEHFPGAEAPSFGAQWQDTYIRRVDATKDTLKATLLATKRLADLATTFASYNEYYGDASQAAEGNRQLNVVTHMYLSLLSEQMNAMIEVQAAGVNAANVDDARRLQEESDRRLTFRQWWEGYTPDPYATIDRGHTGVPGTIAPNPGPL